VQKRAHATLTICSHTCCTEPFHLQLC
jgi:hypothetical protein